MPETRKVRIQGRRFSLADLRNVAELLLAQLRVSEEAGGLPKVAISISADDGTLYESDAIEILDANADALLKRPAAVEIRFSDYRLDRRIIFRVTQSGSLSDALEVRGDDSLWTRGVYASLLERINAVEPSSSWITRHPRLTHHLAQLGLGALMDGAISAVIWGYFRVFGVPPVTPEFAQSLSSSWALKLLFSPTSNVPVKWLLRYGMGAFPWIYVSAWLRKTYPDVEIMIGPLHLREAEAKRRLVSFVVASMLLPIALAAVYDLLKALHPS